MASRRCLKPLHRHYSTLFSSSQSLKPHLPTPSLLQPQTPTSNLTPIHPNPISSIQARHFSFSGRRNHGPHQSEDEDEDEDDEDDDEEEEDDDDELSEGEGEEMRRANTDIGRTYTVEEIEEEANAIGYKVIGPLDPTERPFKYREPFFAVVQIGSHQFKVSNGDSIYTEKLKFCEVNDKLVLTKVLMIGSQTQTIIGRPILPDAAVHAVVEEHALDAKVIIFKKKRRKNYRRTKGHRQELTRLRITDIQGIEKPEKVENPEKIAVAA